MNSKSNTITLDKAREIAQEKGDMGSVFIITSKNNVVPIEEMSNYEKNGSPRDVKKDSSQLDFPSSSLSIKITPIV